MGDHPSAIRWLERAHRLAPADLPLATTLAATWLGRDDARAAALYRKILTRGALREAWVGLARAYSGLSDHARAADALGRALQNHAPLRGVERLANSIVQAVGLPGWCGLLGTGVPVVHPAAGQRTDMHIDGRPVPNSRRRVAWADGRWLSVTANGNHLLGSPIDVAAIGQTVGFVEAWQGGLRGWAAHPGDPDTAPDLTVLDATGRVLRRIRCSKEVVEIAGDNGLLSPRGFHLPAAPLKDTPGPFRVVGRDGRDLLGSPLDPSLLERTVPVPVQSMVVALTASRPAVARPVAVVIPVLAKQALALICLDSVLATRGTGTRIIVVDDGSADRRLTEILDRLKNERDFEVLRHDRPMGFAASANTGIAGCADCDVVLLSGDTLVPPGWLERLTRAAYAAPDIGTVTPFSNDGGLLAYPLPSGPGAAFDRLAQTANTGDPIEIPAGRAFCLFIKRSCLDEVVPFDTVLFAQGDGAVTDFCLRARHRGWRHSVLPSLFIPNDSAIDGGPAGHALRLRNESILNRLHPGYAALVQSFQAADPLAEARRRFDIARWRRTARRGQRAVILITHANGGGVEHRVRRAAAAYRADGLRPIVLRPARLPDGRRGIIVGDGPDGGFPALRFELPAEWPPLLRLLRASHPAWVEVHHMFGHDPSLYEMLRQLDVPYDVHIHDYAWICPRISLMGSENRYCGEPDLAGCEACIARNGSLTGEAIGVGALRQRSAAFLANSRRAIAPSMDTATRMRRYFPHQTIVVVPHEDDTGSTGPTASFGTVRVCILGAIGPHKGFDVLLACARDAAERGLGLEFVVVGDTTGDTELIETGRVHITGTYESPEAVDLIRAQNATLGFVPSVWPETWSLTLGELWQAGLPVAAFDLGAPAERIRTTGSGFVLPLGMPPASINDALLAAARRFGHE